MDFNETFGIELEFICIYPPHTFDSLVKDVRDCEDEYDPIAGICAGYAIYTKLAKRGIPVTGYESLEDDFDYDAAPYSRWLVKVDESLYLSDEERNIVPNDWIVEPVEVASRKLVLSDFSAAEIQAVLEEIFALESMGCRMLTNHTTGFHVHVGNDDQFISLDTAKRMFQLGTVFAPVMDKLHSYPRIHPIEGDSRYFLPPGYFHKNNGKNAESANVFDWLASIESVPDYKELAGLFTIRDDDMERSTNGHNSVYNFDNLDKPAGWDDSEITKTIEFRQHRGTLDYSSVIAWVALTCQIVRFCHTVSDIDFYAFLVYGVNPSTTIRDLCSGVGLADIFTSHFTGEAELPRAIPANSSPYKGRTLRHVFDALDEMNDEESADYVHPVNIELAIADKIDRGLYGMDPDIDIISHPRSAIESYYRTTLGFANIREPSLTAAQKASHAREHLLTYLARLYSGDIYEEDRGQTACVFVRSGAVQRFDLEGHDGHDELVLP